MWLFTKAGFFSVVTAPDRPGMIQVRSRREADTEALAKLAKDKLDMDLTWQTTPDRDYRYRIYMIPAEWEQLAHLLTVDSLDYDNFKASVHGDSLRDNAYMDVWSRMHRYQGDATRKPWPPLPHPALRGSVRNYWMDDPNIEEILDDIVGQDEDLTPCDWCGEMLPADELKSTMVGGMVCRGCSVAMTAGEIDF